MSRLQLSNGQKTWNMNCLSFSSGISSQITSAQVKKMQHHYPIKVSQPDITFNVIFRSEFEYETFQRWIRASQQRALATQGLVTLNWPERNIPNFTGVIKGFQAGGQRFNIAPRASFTVDLVDSFVSKRTELATHTLLWQAIYGAGMTDGVLQPPTEAEINAIPSLTPSERQQLVPNAAPAPNPSQPGFGPAGIASASGVGVGGSG